MVHPVHLYAGTLKLIVRRTPCRDEPAQPVMTPTALVIHEDIKVAAALFLGDVRT